MRILFISSGYYPYVGGLEYTVKSVAERLAMRGHDILVLAGGSRTMQVTEETIGGVRVIR